MFFLISSLVLGVALGNLFKKKDWPKSVKALSLVTLLIIWDIIIFRYYLG